MLGEDGERSKLWMLAAEMGRAYILSKMVKFPNQWNGVLCRSILGAENYLAHLVSLSSLMQKLHH